MTRTLAWLATAGLALALASAALAHPTLSLEELTSNELRRAIAAGKTIILVPIGGTEWNGEHLALGKHNVRARVLAEAIAERLGNALVAPVVSYVPEGSIAPPTGHMRHPGTITIPDDAFEKTLESAARSFRHHGFRTVVLLGDHGGYRKSLRRVAERVNRGAAAPLVLIPAPYYRQLEHAGAEDTALALAVEPRLARDARGASAESGREAMRRIVEGTVEAIRKAGAR